MRTRLLATCLTLSVMACGGTRSEPQDGPKAPEAAAQSSAQELRAALGALPGVEVLGTHEDGTPYMIRGPLGVTERSLRGASAAEAHAQVSAALERIAPAFRLRAADLVAQRAFRDELGHTHVRYAQTRNGLPVVGHELIVHVDDAGRIYAANGSARDGEAVPSPDQAKLTANTARAVALTLTPGGQLTEGEPRLVYARSQVDQRLKLAFEVTVTGALGDRPVRDHVFIDALDSALVSRASDIHEARNRTVYSANHGTGTPGTIVRTEGSPPTGDVVVDKTYDNLGIFYDCFSTLFNRDSYNNAGAPLTATVHYSNNYVSAFYNGTTLVCGDGDGTTALAPCIDPDVVIHEYTHAVTTYTSNLTYSGESGGLNESLSDVFAAVCESWTRGFVLPDADVWKIGEDIWTPGTPGDAIRYMNDPFLDGVSLDYYPNYTSTTDVHYSSGISNLAFYLLSQGGTHPRGRTTISVTGIGVEKAARIFYRANSVYLTASATFAQAKTATEQAATDLGYGTAVVASVTAAWQAVGVGVTPPCSTTTLSNGIGVLNLSGAAGSTSCPFVIAVPAGATNLKVETYGGTGDVDLYVKRGAVPTTTSYDCRPYLAGNTEACTFPTPVAGSYYIILRGYTAYSGVTLRASFTRPDGSTVLWVPNISGAAGSQQLWTYDAVAGQTVTVKIAPGTGSTGDVDLYVRFGAAPTLTTYDCRPYLAGNNEQCVLTRPTAGTYYILLNGYSAYSGVTLTAQ